MIRRPPGSVHRPAHHRAGPTDVNGVVHSAKRKEARGPGTSREPRVDKREAPSRRERDRAGVQGSNVGPRSILGRRAPTVPRAKVPDLAAGRYPVGSSAIVYAD
jgi:hypothetical protein